MYDDDDKSCSRAESFANNSSGNGDASDGFADPSSLIVSPVSDEEAQQNSPSSLNDDDLDDDSDDDENNDDFELRRRESTRRGGERVRGISRRYLGGSHISEEIFPFYPKFLE